MEAAAVRRTPGLRPPEGSISTGRPAPRPARVCINTQEVLNTRRTESGVGTAVDILTKRLQ